MSNRVLITGANSFVGRHITSHFVRSGLEVIATYRNQNNFLERLSLEAENLTLWRIDISNWQDFTTLPTSVDAVVHIAGVSAMASVSIDDMLAVNVNGTRNVQRYALQSEARKFIYVSSLSIHGRIEEEVVDEHTIVNNPDTYGASKYLGERMLAATATTMPTVAVRLPGVLGPGAHRAWIPTLVERLVSGADISIYSPAAAFNNAIHVNDLSRFFTHILCEQNWRGFYAFPVGASGKMTILEVVRLLQEKLGSVSKLQENSNPVKPSFLIDSTCAMECFGYVPMQIDLMLKHYLKDLLQS